MRAHGSGGWYLPLTMPLTSCSCSGLTWETAKLPIWRGRSRPTPHYDAAEVNRMLKPVSFSASAWIAATCSTTSLSEVWPLLLAM